MKTKIVMIALVLTFVGALVGGCKSKTADKDEGPKRKAMMSEVERGRALQACIDYVTKLCVCSKMKPENADLAKRCQMEKALPDALHVALGVDADPAADPTTVASAQATVNKILKTCVEGMNEMVRSAEFTNCL